MFCILSLEIHLFYFLLTYSSLVVEKGTILSEYANGIIGNLGFFIPHITATRYPEFSSYTGLSGDINRVKLAQVFKTPITWKEYCDSYDCTLSESAASREPENADEEALYFMEGIYTGFFEANNVTDCETNPECMGHFVAPSCGWSVYAESQLYWNNIGLKSNGPLEPNNGYSYSQMYQVWRAAKATNSDIIMVFYTPDPFVDTLAKSVDYAFHRVSLPPLTEACMAAQINLDRCSDDIDERRGTVFAKCDYAHRPLSKVISRGLQTQSVSSIDGALNSPAFEILSRIKLPDLAIQSIFDEMTDGETTTLSARSATCRWVHDNLQEFTRDFPLSYPRQKTYKEFNDVSYAGFFFGSIAIIVSITAFALTYYWRDNRTIASAQTDILFSMLIGYTLVSISSLLHAALENNNTLCILKTWTMHVGYCMALIPILVKMSAINKIRRNSRSCRRVKIDKNLFKKIITGALGIVVIFIIVWTVVDPPSRVETYLLIEDDDKDIQNTTVEVYESCSSKSSTWNIIALVVEFLILLSSTVLAFQSRDVMQFVADSHLIGVLVYSHTLFLIASIVNVMTNSGAKGSSLAQKITSVIVSIETIVAICVYFVTKFFIIYRESEDISENSSDLRSGSSHVTKGSTKKEKKEEAKSAVPLIQLDSSRYSVISRKSSCGSGGLRRMTVSGVKIPEGGIPNLIKSKAQMEEEIKQIKQTRRSSSVVSEASDCAKPLKRQSVSMVSFCEDLENDGDVNIAPSNGILKRKNSFGINADIVYENEKLREEVESLREQLNLYKEEGIISCRETDGDEIQYLLGGEDEVEDNLKEDWLPNERS